MHEPKQVNNTILPSHAPHRWAQNLTELCIQIQIDPQPLWYWEERELRPRPQGRSRSWLLGSFIGLARKSCPSHMWLGLLGNLKASKAPIGIMFHYYRSAQFVLIIKLVMNLVLVILMFLNLHSYWSAEFILVILAFLNLQGV